MNDSVGPKGHRVRSLETRIPPPIVAALMGAAMWWLASLSPVLHVPASIRAAVALAIAAVGGMVAMGPASASAARIPPSIR